MDTSSVKQSVTSKNAAHVLEGVGSKKYRTVLTTTTRLSTLYTY